MLRTWTEKYDEAMSDEHPQTIKKSGISGSAI